MGEGTEMRRNPNKVRRFELGGPGTKGEGKRSIISATLGRNWKRQVGQAQVVDPSRPLGGTVVYHRFEAASRNYVQYRMREPRKEKWEFAGGGIEALTNGTRCIQSGRIYGWLLAARQDTVMTTTVTHTNANTTMHASSHLRSLGLLGCAGP